LTPSHRSEFLYAKLGLSPLQPGDWIKILLSAPDFTSFQIRVAAVVVGRRVRWIEPDRLIEVLEGALGLKCPV
jgi:hypothetical protein